MGNETSPTQMMMMMRRRMRRRRRGWSYLRKCEIPSNTRYTSIYLGIFFSIVSVDFPITLDFLIGKPTFSYVFSLKCHIFPCFFMFFPLKPQFFVWKTGKTVVFPRTPSRSWCPKAPQTDIGWPSSRRRCLALPRHSCGTPGSGQAWKKRQEDELNMTHF